MALLTNRKFIHFNKLSDFETNLENNSISDYQICFIKDAQKIWTHGVFYSQSEVYIGNTQPTDSNVKIWIDTSEDASTVEVYTKSQVNNAFIPVTALKSNDNTENEIGVTEKYYAVEKDVNGKLAVNVPWEAGAKVTETLNVNLTTNFGDSSDLDNVTISIILEGETKTATGSSATFDLPFGESYTISVSSVSGYQTPANQTYTSVLGNTRIATFTYKKVKVQVALTSNQSDNPNYANEINFAKVSINGTEVMNGNFIYLPMDSTNVSVEYGTLSDYSKPNNITIASFSENTYTITGQYNTTVLTTVANVDSAGGKTSDDVTFTINGNTNVMKVPTGSSVTYSVNDLTGYGVTISPTSPFTATGASQTITATYVYGSVFTASINSNQDTISGNRTDASTNLSGETITLTGTGLNETLSHGDTCLIVPGTKVTVSFSNSNTEYKKPESYQFTSVAGTNYNSDSSIYQTEVVSVTFTTNKASVNGQTVTVNGVTKTWAGSTLTFKVPYGVSDLVTASAKSGYKCTITTLGTANALTKSATVAYTELVSGIYVMEANGTEVAISQGNSSCVGVVVRDADKNIAFFIAKTSKNSISWSGSHSSLNITGITENDSGYTNSSPGITDIFRSWSNEYYANGETGVSNTDKIVAQCTKDTTSNNAAKYCRSIANPVTGKYDGYLGSNAEWIAVFDNLSDINTAMNKIGGTLLTSTDSGYTSGNTTYTYYWTSSEYGASRAWLLYFGSVDSYPFFDNYVKSRSGQNACSRPFYPL